MLGLAALIGCINYLWIKLPPAIGMLLGSLIMASLIVSSDHVFHLHIMRWFRGTFAAANLPHFFLDGVLALLLFGGSLHVNVGELRRRGLLILLLATASVILSTIVLQHRDVVRVRRGRRRHPARLVLRPRRHSRADRRGRGRASAEKGEICRPACMRRSSAKACSMMAPASCCSCCALGVTAGQCRGARATGRSLLALLREIAGGAVLGFFTGWARGIAVAPRSRPELAATDLARAGAGDAIASPTCSNCRGRSPLSSAGLRMGSQSWRSGFETRLERPS